jgi:hypothetical protein
MGQLSIDIEDEKEKEENCSSSAALLHPEKSLSHTKDEAEQQEETKEEEREEDCPLCVGNITPTLPFLIDAKSCVEPFEKEIVDQRDTLLSFILSKDEHYHYSERITNAVQYCLKFIAVVLSVMSI